MAVKRKKQKDPELDLVPIMNLVTILIPFLIMAAEFIQLAVIDSSAPPIGEPDPNQEPEEDPFSLTVTLQQDGIVIDGSPIVRDAITEGYPEFDFSYDSNGNREPLIRCRDGQGTDLERCEMADHYDWEELATMLRQVKLDSTEGDDVEEDVILQVAGTVRYEIVVQAMDVIRDGNGFVDLESNWNRRSDDGSGGDPSRAPLVLFPRIALSGNNSN
jgi:biopolymer transport protein ExbD